MVDGLSRPLVVCVRGPSRSGKSTLCESLIRELRSDVRVAWTKRTHHCLDLPHKSSGRIWEAAPAAMVVHAPDRLQLTFPAPAPAAESLVAALPPTIDLILLETHEPEPFATILAESLPPADGEQVIGRFSLETASTVAASLAAVIRTMLPADLLLARSLRLAALALDGHLCPELILGTRLAVTGATALGTTLPDAGNHLEATVETNGCAAAAIQALVPKRAPGILDYGKLAATFSDHHSRRALHLAVRGDVCRAFLDSGEDLSTTLQQLAEIRAEELFSIREAPFMDSFAGAGQSPHHVTCTGCGDEVFGGRQIITGSGEYCRPCSAELYAPARQERQLAPWR